MVLKENTVKSLSLACNATVISDQVYKKLIEYTFVELLDVQSPNVGSLCNTKPDVIKELYAALLTAASEFGRNNVSEDDVSALLTKRCNFPQSRAAFLAQEYGRNKVPLQIKLGNVGYHLPHIVDVQWKIDYIVKASTLDLSEGPLFRITLITEKHDSTADGKKVDHIKFACTSEELQDLIYKLSDTVRHCHKIAGE